MKKAVLRRFKQSLTFIGAALSDKSIHNLQMILNYARLGRWMKAHGFKPPMRSTDREQVFGIVAKMVKHEKVLYLEFGVYRGRSIRWWSQALKNADSILHGFDSFEGLPEAFDDAGGKYIKGWFSADGQLPHIDDPRVQFFKGWFDHTLPMYKLPAHDVLLINCDADLYSSTIYVLKTLQPYIRKGTYLYMDDMSRPDHEPRALEEFMLASGLTFRVLAADVTLNNVFFICEG